MHFPAAKFVTLAVIGVIAATMKIVSTVRVSRSAAVSKAARAVYLVQTIFLFTLVGLALARFFFPPVWQFSIFDTRTFVVLIGILVILWLAYLALLWRGRKTMLQKHDAAEIR
ncbi:MAG TPA: hypothetical protein VGR81_01885 [Candidatus Acidoferrales bacterium]|nr:hypothetical protein [Candidatus Acidoferrales bacterium]